MLKVLLLSFTIIGIAVAAIAIRMFFFKGGEFKKSCSSVDPKTGQRLGCTCEKGDGGGQCENRPQSQ